MYMISQPLTTLTETIKSGRDEELGIGTSNRLLLCGELEDEVTGTVIVSHFFQMFDGFRKLVLPRCWQNFLSQMILKKHLAFLDPRNRSVPSTSGIATLAFRFTSFSTDDTDSLLLEFRDYRVALDHQLPAFVPSDDADLDHF